jgi:hypothetical protein
MNRSWLLTILYVVCLSIISCGKPSPPPPPFVPEEVASAFLKRLEINYIGLSCEKDNNGWRTSTCIVNIDNKMQKLDCYKYSQSEGCSLITK